MKENNVILVNNRSCMVLHFITEWVSTDARINTEHEVKGENLSKVGENYLNYTSDQSVSPVLPTQTLIGTVAQIHWGHVSLFFDQHGHKNLHYIQPISGLTYRPQHTGSQEYLNVFSSNIRKTHPYYTIDTLLIFS